jgi:hypothetical protein
LIREGYCGGLEQIPSVERPQVVRALAETRADWIPDVLVAFSVDRGTNGVGQQHPSATIEARSSRDATRDRELRELREMVRERDEKLVLFDGQIAGLRNDLDQAVRDRLTTAARAKALIEEVSAQREHIAALETGERELRLHASELSARLDRANVELITARTDLRKLQPAVVAPVNKQQVEAPAVPASPPDSPAAKQVVELPAVSNPGPQRFEAAGVFFQKLAAAHNLPTNGETLLVDPDARLGSLAAELVEFFCQIERSVFANLKSIAERRPEFARLETELRAFAKSDKTWWWSMTAPQASVKSNPIGKFRVYARQIHTVNQILLYAYFDVLKYRIAETARAKLNPHELTRNLRTDPWEHYCDKVADFVPLDLADRCMETFAENVVAKYRMA